jgi:hypothetical protein
MVSKEAGYVTAPFGILSRQVVLLVPGVFPTQANS